MRRSFLVLISVVVLGAIWGCGGSSSTPVTVVKTADGKVSYSQTIQPVLMDSCGSCHSEKRAKGGLVLASYSGLMKGGNRGAVVIAGNADESQIIGSVERTKEPHMPPAFAGDMPTQGIAALRQWINEGALDN
jgi:mono/diheme cytochrome c family protein